MNYSMKRFRIKWEFSKKELQLPLGHNPSKPRILCNGNGAISRLQTEMGFLRTSVTACIFQKNIFSAPFGIFYMRTEI